MPERVFLRVTQKRWDAEHKHESNNQFRPAYIEHGASPFLATIKLFFLKNQVFS